MRDSTGFEMLTVEVEKKLGDFAVTAKFASETGATVLFGPSGAGKTTVVNMIAGLLRPDRGRIALDDEVVFDDAAGIDVPVWRRRTGYVFQEGRLFPHLSVKHNLDYGRWMGGHPADPAAFAHAVELLDIGHLLDRRPGKLSGGERQRVAVGRALMNEPTLVLFDEPTSALDTQLGDQVMHLIRSEVKGRGTAAVIVTHDTRVTHHCDRSVSITDGRLEIPAAV